MFFKFIYRALQYRKQRLTLAFAALAIAATLATVLFGIYGTVEARIRSEFQSYGANIVAVPANSANGPQTIPITLVEAARKRGAEAAPFLVTSTTVDNQPVAVAAFDPEASRPLTPYWHIVRGTRDIHPGECIAGELLNLDIGAQTPVGTVKGIVSTGAAEDNELLTT